MTVIDTQEKTSIQDVDSSVDTNKLQDEQVKKSNMFDSVESSSSGLAAVNDPSIIKKATVVSSDKKDKTVTISSSFTEEDLEITPENKANFIEAMLTGERYKETYNIFGGKVSLTIRSRTTAETNALYSYIRHQLAKSQDTAVVIEGDLTYIPLVAQVEELNGTSFPEMKAPLTFESSAGVETTPGWLPDFVAWKNKPEGLTSAIISCVQLFEYKYWLMVKEANNKNFWNTDTSTTK